MIRRLLVGATPVLCAVLLSACNGSPEAGRVTPAPSSTTPSATPTSSGSPTASPEWTAEELSAIASARARYIAARAAVESALRDPTKATRDALEKAGNGGDWVNAAASEVSFQRDNGWYQTGSAKVLSTAVQSVNLKIEQPEVRLSSCIDSSSMVTRYRSSGKPVPMGPGDGTRHKFQSRLVFAPSVITGSRMWFLTEEKAIGSC
jgi:hypothetical protein